MTTARYDATGARYTRVAIWLHWIIAALLILNLAIGLLNDSLFKGWIPAHKAIGITVLLLSLVRLGWRLAHPAPPLPASMPGWEKGVAHLSHWTLYGLMILLPLSGWIFTSASVERRPLDFFGLFPIPYLPVPQSKAFGGPWHEAHELMGWAILALIALHVAAALKHHFVDRNTVLTRMMPGRSFDRR